MKQAFIHEIFSGIQGEGLFVGLRQIFLRMCGCNLNCRFCDTPASLGRTPACRIEQTAGQRNFEKVMNPVDLDHLLHDLSQLNTTVPHHSLALTGGEPLMQTDFLMEALPQLRPILPIFLETNGTMPEEFARIATQVDIVAMDIKIPSATHTKDYFPQHQQFLNIAKQSNTVLFVKIIVTSDIIIDELKHAFTIIANFNPATEVILQPVTSISHETETLVPSPSQILRFQELGLQQLQSVRVIPQTHKLIGQL